MQFKENILLSQFSNYKIGGEAQFFFAPQTEEEVAWAVREARERYAPVFVLGGGTNLLIPDGGFHGLVLKPELVLLKKEGATIVAGAGISMKDLLTFAAKNNLSGLEWAGGLPGTLGGAIRGNAGCFGGEIKDVVASVRSFDVRAMKFVERSGRACAFGYRTSVFKSPGLHEVIISATLKLKKGNAKKIRAASEEKVAYRKKNHPLEYPNIGSMFKNVPLERVHKKGSTEYKRALKEGRTLFKGSPFTVKIDPFPVISTAKLISESGLRGTRSGGAQFSEKHPNFIVNINHATAKDVKKLVELAKSKVKKKFGVQLEEEVQIL